MLSSIILFTLIGSVVSLVGGILLLFREKFAIRISHYLASFAAGALLGTAFFDLLPEASEHSGGINIFFWIFIGFIIFFLLERFITWFHHHQETGKRSDSVVPLVILGDGIHNFIDGVAIASSFMVDPGLGVATAFAVGTHEIPQEIGDFGLLLHRGVSRFKVLWWNLVSALTSLAGAVLTYFMAGSIEGLLPVFLSLTAGFFIYIAASDLIPEIHNQEKRQVAFIETLLLLLGSATIWAFVAVLEGAH